MQKYHQYRRIYHRLDKFLRDVPSLGWFVRYRLTELLEADPAGEQLRTCSLQAIWETSVSCRQYSCKSNPLSDLRLDVSQVLDEMNGQVKGDEACFCVSSTGLEVIQEVKSALMSTTGAQRKDVMTACTRT